MGKGRSNGGRLPGHSPSRTRMLSSNCGLKSNVEQQRRSLHSSQGQRSSFPLMVGLHNVVDVRSFSFLSSSFSIHRRPTSKRLLDIRPHPTKQTRFIISEQLTDSSTQLTGTQPFIKKPFRPYDRNFAFFGVATKRSRLHRVYSSSIVLSCLFHLQCRDYYPEPSAERLCR